MVHRRPLLWCWRVVARREASHQGAHPGWCARDVAAEFDGLEHVSRTHRWRPTYEHEVAIVDLLRQVVHLDDDAETSIATVHIDNPSEPGEVALSAEDVAAFVDRLLRLRDALVDERGDPRE
jgi:hypothetical protein